MNHSQTFGFSRSAAQLLVASIALALLTFVCFRLRLHLATTVCLYLIVIVLLSLQGSFLLSAVVSLIAVGCLAYYFAPPIFSFRVSDPFDAVAIITFLTTSAVITHMVSRVRKSVEEAHSEIEDRKRAEEALRQSEEQWRDVFENNPTMYFIVNAAGIVMAVNSFGAEQLGYNVDELVGQPVLSVFYESDREGVERNVAICLEQLGRAKSWEARKVRKDGTVLRVRETAKAVPRVSGPIVLIACEDITEQKRAEEALGQAQAELAHVTRVTTLGEMTASIAHEVNQPLAAVVNNASACLRWLAASNQEEARQSATLIIADAHRASEIIGRIRAFVKKAPPQKAWFNINETILEVIALARSEVQGNRVSLQTQLSDDVPLILGDRIQLQQVILNLIINAIEAMSGVGENPREVLIGSEKDESQGVRVTVRDSGPGLDPGSLNHIFTAFYTTKPQGMGMGLPISRSIIEAHGGRLWATANESRGAVFQFTLLKYR